MAGLQNVLAALQMGGQPLGNISRSSPLIPNIPKELLPTALQNLNTTHAGAVQPQQTLGQVQTVNPIDNLSLLNQNTQNYLNQTPQMEAILKALGAM
jgi:hypothetical protein